MTFNPEDDQAVVVTEVILDESGTPPQEGETVYDPSGSYYRVLRSIGPGASTGWWIIEGKLIN